jgi:predicted AlkP superfamily phosphohydrolase/phosphomutase
MTAAKAGTRDALVSTLDWMAANAYQPHWPGMRVFALPSFYDGRVRVNLAGRERNGRVPLADYRRVIDEVKSLLDACVDPLTGEGVVDFYEQPDRADPRQLGATESDLVIVWKGMPLGLEHPRLGRIGPVPFRRVGGHTGPHGVAWVAGDGVATGGQGVASAFDVVPTILDLLGVSPPGELSGRSLLETPAANVRLRHSGR